MRAYELFETVQWAVGKNIKQATTIGKMDLTTSTNTLIWVDIRELYDYTWQSQRLDIDHPEGGPIGISNKIQRVKDHWQEGGYVDPSYLVWDRNEKAFVFVDGRHRLVAAYQLGEKWAPIIAANQETVDMIRDLVKIK